MSVSHSITRTYDNGAEAVSKTETVTSGSVVTLDETIPAPSTNLAVAFAFVKTKLQSIWIHSDQTLTIYTNDASTGSPADTIVVTADRPRVWTTGDASFMANPFAGDVTSLYVTKAAGYSPRIKHLPAAPQGVHHRVCDPKRMLAFYDPQVTLEEGICRALGT